MYSCTVCFHTVQPYQTVDWKTYLHDNAPMFTKVNVRGEKAHPFYKNLAAETNSSPKWNFWKYLINKDGEVVKSYSMVTSPKGDKLVSMINKLLSE